MRASGRADRAPRPGTAARAHRQSVDRGEGHGGGEAAAAVDRAQLALAKIGDDEPILGKFRRDVTRCSASLHLSVQAG